MSKKHSNNLTPALVDTFKVVNELALHTPYKYLPHRDIILDLTTLTYFLTKYPNRVLPALQAKHSQPPALPDLSEDFGPHTIQALQSLIAAIDPHHPAGMTIAPTEASPDPSEASPLEPLFASLPEPESVLYKDIASNYGQGVHTIAHASRRLFDDANSDLDPTQDTEPLHEQMIMGSDGKDHIW